jgi:hypothetical protein
MLSSTKSAQDEVFALPESMVTTPMTRNEELRALLVNGENRNVEEVAAFARVAALDIVARCRAREINYVAVVLKKMADRPKARHATLKKRTSKWINEYDWLVTWLSGLADGEMRRISRPMDEGVVLNKLISSIRNCYNNRVENWFDRRQQVRNYDEKELLISHSSGVVQLTNYEPAEMRERVGAIVGDLTSELTHISLLKLAAIVSKYGQEGKVAPTSTHDKRFRDGQFRRDIELHLGVSTAVIYPLLRFLGVYVPPEFEAKNNRYMEKRGPKIAQMEGLLADLLMAMPEVIREEEQKQSVKLEQWEDKLIDDILDARCALSTNSSTEQEASKQRRTPASVYMAKVRKRARRYMNSSMCHQVELSVQFNDSTTSLSRLEDSPYMPWNYATPATYGIEDQGDGVAQENEAENEAMEGAGEDTAAEEINMDDYDVAIVGADGEESAPVDLMPVSSHRKVFLGNLPLGVDPSSISSALMGCGPVETVQIHTDEAMVAEQQAALEVLEQREQALAAKIAEGLEIKRRRGRRRVDERGEPVELTAEEQIEQAELDAEMAAQHSIAVDARLKKEIKSLRSLRQKAVLKTTKIAKSVKSDTHAFVTFATDEGYIAATRNDVQIFGVAVNDPVSGMGRLSRAKPASHMRTLFVEVATSMDGGKKYQSKSLQMKHILPSLEAALGESFELSSGGRDVDNKKPFYIMLRFPDHESAWKAFKNLRKIATEPEIDEGGEESPLVLSPYWVGTRNYYMTRGQLAQRRRLDQELAGSTITEVDLLRAPSTIAEQMVGVVESDTGGVPRMTKDSVMKSMGKYMNEDDDEPDESAGPLAVKGSRYKESETIWHLDDGDLEMDLDDDDDVYDDDDDNDDDDDDDDDFV